MKTTFPKTLATAGLIYLGLATSCVAFDGPERLDINLQASNPSLEATNKNLKTVPGFSHAAHATKFLINNSSHAGGTYNDSFTCTACHPGVQSTEEIGSKKAKDALVAAIEQGGGIKKYMHGICLGCHKSMKKTGITTGPTSCKKCHNPS